MQGPTVTPFDAAASTIDVQLQDAPGTLESSAAAVFTRCSTIDVRSRVDRVRVF